MAEQHLYVINPPGALSFMGGLFQRLFSDKPFPASINYLSSGFAPVRIERVDAQTIIVTPEGGYTPLPGPIVDDKTGMVTQVHLENVYRALDGFHYNPRNPMQVGQVVALSEVTVEVTEMTGDGRIAQAAFTFAHPLDETGTFGCCGMKPLRLMREYRCRRSESRESIPDVKPEILAVAAPAMLRRRLRRLRCSSARAQ